MKISHLPDTFTIEKSGQRIYVYDEQGKAICGSRKRDGTPCRDHPMQGKARCWRHGGRNKSGKEHSQYRHGERIMRYDVPEKLAKHFENLANDPDLLDLRSNLQLLDVRIAELMEKFDHADFGEAVLPQLAKLSYRAEKALRDKDMDTFAELWVSMTELIRRGQGDYLTWQDVIKTNDKRREMTKTIVDIELSKHKALSMSELMYIVDQLFRIYRESNTLDDPQERESEYINGIRLLLNAKSPS